MPKQNLFWWEGLNAQGEKVRYENVTMDDILLFEKIESDYKKKEEEDRRQQQTEAKLGPAMARQVAAYAQKEGITQESLSGLPTTSTAVLPSGGEEQDEIMTALDRMPSSREDTTELESVLSGLPSRTDPSGLETGLEPEGVEQGIGAKDQMLESILDGLPKQVARDLIIRFHTNAITAEKLRSEVEKWQEFIAKKKIEKEYDTTGGYGKSSVGAALAFTEAHPELVQAGRDILNRLRDEGKYSETLLQSIDANLRTDVRQALRDLNNLQGRTEEKVRSLEETLPGKIKTAAGTAAASGEAGTRARIETEYETKTGIPGSFKQSQYTAANYAFRIEQSEDVLKELFEKGFNPGSFYNMIKSPDAFNAIKNPKQRRYAQAMRNFINATLRRESGAVIAESEFTNANRQYFAQLNDDPEVTAQKANNRMQVLSAFTAEAGGALDQVRAEYKKKQGEYQIGDTIVKNGVTYRYIGNDQWEEVE